MTAIPPIESAIPDQTAKVQGAAKQLEALMIAQMLPAPLAKIRKSRDLRDRR